MKGESSMKYIVMIVWILIIGMISNYIKDHYFLYSLGYFAGCIGTLIVVLWGSITIKIIKDK